VARPGRPQRALGAPSGGRRNDPNRHLGLGPVVYGVNPDPGVSRRYHRLVCGDWGDEDPRSPTYNTFRHVACGTTPPFGGGSEALWRITPAYRLFAVIQYNAAPIVPGRGSAIFLHIDTGRATNGCVSLPYNELQRLLVKLRTGATIRIQTA
jgi:L,D-peptidoglycan transpeptidase YkuD (ErfK/YbiS/YcfS/YnhG family)